MPKVCLLVALIGLVAWGAADSSAGGTIAGTVPAVKDEIGKRAVITWTRQITIGITNAAQADAVATDDKGQFTISGLVGGTYALCAQIPGSTYLDPCVWNETLPQVELKTGGKVNGVKLDLVKGVRLQLEVDDTDQKLSSAENKNGANLLVRVPRPHGPALDLRPISSTKGQRTYGVIVPEFVQMRASLRALACLSLMKMAMAAAMTERC